VLEGVRRLVRHHVPHLDDDRHFQPDIEKAADLVGRCAIVGAVVDILGRDILPTLDGSPPA
jgi:histidine ammonia-lyase